MSKCSHGQEQDSCVYCHYEDTVDRPDPNAVSSCPSCAAKDVRIRELEESIKLRDELVIPNKEQQVVILQSRIALLEKVEEWVEDLLMGTIPEYPECGNVQALDELRCMAKEGVILDKPL